MIPTSWELRRVERGREEVGSRAETEKTRLEGRQQEQKTRAKDREYSRGHGALGQGELGKEMPPP